MQSPQLMNDLEFYTKRLRTEVARQQSDSYQAFVPVQVFEDIIVHISRRLDNFEQRLYSIESSNLYNDDILKLIREEYKQFSSIYKTSISDIKTDIEIHTKYIKQLEKAQNDNTAYLNELSINAVSKDELNKQNRVLNDQIDSLNTDLQSFISSSTKSNQVMVLKTKEMELSLDNVKNNNTYQQNNEAKENAQINSHQIQKIFGELREEQQQTVSKMQHQIEREVEWIKSNLIKVIDLVIQQNKL